MPACKAGKAGGRVHLMLLKVSRYRSDVGGGGGGRPARPLYGRSDAELGARGSEMRRWELPAPPLLRGAEGTKKLAETFREKGW